MNLTQTLDQTVESINQTQNRINEFSNLTVEQAKTINIITNLIQSLESPKDKNDLAFMIHCIIEGEKINYDLLASYKIEANKDLFMRV